MGERYAELAERFLLMHKASRALVAHCGRKEVADTVQQQVDDLRKAADRMRAVADDLDSQAGWLAQGLAEMLTEELALPKITEETPDGR